MKLVTFLNERRKERLGLYHNGMIADLEVIGIASGYKMPTDILTFLNNWDEYFPKAQELNKLFIANKLSNLISSENVKLLAPVPHPPSCRDAYAFRQHVEAARRNRGLDMIPEFDQYPIFYFTNHNAIYGEGEIIVEKDHLEQLDFELEIAAVICRRGKNIDSHYADDYIAGYTIMNDFSARKLQMEEMKLNLGPAKGKDFATSIGPWLVTKDELSDRFIKTQFGEKYDLTMRAYHNGVKVSEGNAKDMNWTFAEIIERCSYGTEIYPGDVIGSGTVGTGCYLELNGTWGRLAQEKGEKYTPIWLKDGDVIELEIDLLGNLKNHIVYSGSEFSILAKKKI